MNPRTRNVVVVAVVVIVVVAGLGVYFLLPRVPATCRSGQTSTICVDQAETPDSLDPAVTFSTPGWAAVQQVYQGLVNYNGSSYTSFDGVLAYSNWSVANNPLTNFSEYTFHLRPGIHFSNGDPYNAYVQWYSLYRTLLMAQGPQFILEQNFFSTNFSPTNPLSYYSPQDSVNASNQTLLADLNSWNFTTPSSTALTDMELPNQSFQVIDAQTIQLNLGFGYLASNYTYLLASLAAPTSYAVDPIWVDQHGGIQIGFPNGYLSDHTLGTGPYTLSNYDGNDGGGYTLTPDPNYWAKTSAASEPWNNLIQPAKLSVDVRFQSSVDITVNDLKNGVVQTASLAYVGPSTVSSLSGLSNVIVQQLPTVYGATSGSWWVYLNQSTYPFNNSTVREAISYAINYSQIIDQAFGGYAEQWVGPVPPSYPYYNPANLSPYSFDPTLAGQLINQTPCAHDACAGTAINYEYLNTGPDWAITAQILKSDLANIGITINPEGIPLSQLYDEQALQPDGTCGAANVLSGVGPFPMGQEFYTSDYISPDDWTQNDAISYGSANACMSGYDNATVDNLVLSAAAESNPVLLNQYYTNITSAMYTNYTDIWLVVPHSFGVYSTSLHGFVQNPMASAEPFAFLFNTDTIS